MESFMSTFSLEVNSLSRERTFFRLLFSIDLLGTVVVGTASLVTVSGLLLNSQPILICFQSFSMIHILSVSQTYNRTYKVFILDFFEHNLSFHLWLDYFGNRNLLIFVMRVLVECDIFASDHIPIFSSKTEILLSHLNHIQWWCISWISLTYYYQCL